MNSNLKTIRIESIYDKPLSKIHPDDTPLGRWAGNLFFSTGVNSSSVDSPVQKNTLASKTETQISRTFDNLDHILRMADLNHDAIGQCIIWINDPADQSLVEQYWKIVFPDQNNAPARQIAQTKLDHDQRITIDFIAVDQCQRKCIVDIPNIGRRAHEQSAPLATVMGDFLFAPFINGVNKMGELVKEPGEQADQAFENISALLKYCGFSTDDVAHLFVWQSDHNLRQRINDPWEALFPNKYRRPARHALKMEFGDMAVQFSLIAVRHDKRMNLTQLGGITHTAQRSPGFLPISVSRGDLLLTAATFGADRQSGDFIEEVNEQVHSAFSHSLEIIEKQGFRLEDVAHVYVWHKGDEYLREFEPLWQAAFSDPATRPARHDIESPLPLSIKIQIELIAVRSPAATLLFEPKKEADIDAG